MMKLNSKNHQRNCRDRLTELPDEILVHILTFLPLKEAVRTVLLRRFGKLWTLLPSLNFQGCDREYIRGVMRCHKNPTIDVIHIKGLPNDLHDGTYPIDQHLKECVHFALRKRVKTLIVTHLRSHCGFVPRLPALVFSNQDLISLELVCFDIKLPRHVFMGSLWKLELYNAFISNETFSKLISACPCLKELIVGTSYALTELHFTAQSIESLELYLSLDREPCYVKECYSLDCPNLKILYIEDIFIDNLKVIDVSSVLEAKIYNCDIASFDDSDTTVYDYFEPLLKNFRSAKVFDLNFKSYRQLEPCGSMKWTSEKHDFFDLTVSPGIHGSCVLGLCRLLRNSQYLCKLTIYADEEFFCNCDVLVPEVSSPCVMQYLTTVTIRDCLKPCQGLIQLIKFLLSSAIALDQLVICCNKKDRLFSLEGRPFILELLIFPRASQKAKVVID